MGRVQLTVSKKPDGVVPSPRAILPSALIDGFRSPASMPAT